jgi:hypothetical protein
MATTVSQLLRSAQGSKSNQRTPRHILKSIRAHTLSLAIN